MTDLSRRGMLAAGILATFAAAGCHDTTDTPPAAVPHPSGRVTTILAGESSTASHASHPSTSHTTPTATSRHGRILDHLPPSATPRVALTVDDGIRPDVVAGYARLCRFTGLRMTFFANGCYDSWADNRTLLTPMVESGQIQFGNHTWDHPALTRCSDAEIARQLRRNETHFVNLFGHERGMLRPYLRPPYGYVNSHVVHVAADLGYTDVVLWYGTLGDDQNISTARIEANARTWMTNSHIVIGHANHPGTLGIYPTLHRIITSRHLRTVTLADVFGR